MLTDPGEGEPEPEGAEKREPEIGQEHRPARERPDRDGGRNRADSAREKEGHAGPGCHALLDQAADQRQCRVAVQIGRNADQRRAQHRQPALAANRGAHRFGRDVGQHQAFEKERDGEPLAEEQGIVQRVGAELRPPIGIVPERPCDP